MDDTVTRQQLLDMGLTVREIASRVHSGRLVRVRRGHYATPDTALPVQRAVRLGGRLGCVSELRQRGVWVLDGEVLHVHVAPNAARLRDADDREQLRTERVDCRVHWMPLIDPGGASQSHVSAIDAIAQAFRCLDHRAAQAALDSAVRMRVLGRRDLARLSRALGLQHPLTAEVRAESGLETIVRVLMLELGFEVRVQVWFGPEIRVDLLIEDWVVIETDGNAFHDAAVTTRDRRRDAVLAAQGRTVLHFRYAQVVFELPSVAAAVISAVEAHRRVRNSGQKARTARRRAEKLGLA